MKFSVLIEEVNIFIGFVLAGRLGSQLAANEGFLWPRRTGPLRRPSLASIPSLSTRSFVRFPLSSPPIRIRSDPPTLRSLGTTDADGSEHDVFILSPFCGQRERERESDTRDWHKFGFPEIRMRLRNVMWLRDHLHP